MPDPVPDIGDPLARPHPLDEEAEAPARRRVRRRAEGDSRIESEKPVSGPEHGLGPSRTHHELVSDPPRSEAAPPEFRPILVGLPTHVHLERGAAGRPGHPLPDECGEFGERSLQPVEVREQHPIALLHATARETRERIDDEPRGIRIGRVPDLDDEPAGGHNGGKRP